MDWFKMYLKIMIAISLAALGLALLVPANEQYKVLLQFLVCASAALIVSHALRAKPDYLWAGTFGSVAVLFNPIIPVPLPSRALFTLELACMVLFLAYYSAFKMKPRKSMVSIAEQSGPPIM
jgi:hypothetical protein